MSEAAAQPLDDEDDLLINAATTAVRKFGDGVRHTVGAALLTEDGTRYTAVNVFAQGGGACAELAVIAKAVSDGRPTFRRIVAVGDANRGVVEPCGVCRQLLLDYAPSIEVIVRDGDRLRRASIAELMPLAHRSWFADDV